ncbi:ABC transporter ATP-binding protein [Desulfovibrio intestinalis]|uniref:Nickel transport system ATP-binding protein n=1 Tax=Desulfovibrio intestinalis TaxID=58621 RepID=A0A7W8C167_9BACT|nr:dipeptide/oligopeptide/nickel ABC transporter ATP-binding protein [Desulfovibrio intestinalis]MBB5143693.1 nickel transport system ATP-binding protein [Desulfovibrio intestinalis]
MLEVANVCKSYGKGGFWRTEKQPVLHGINISVPAGASVGLVGESGSGKSTLGRLILGLEPADSGRILMQGQPVRQWRKKHAGGMSVVFQDYTTSVNPAYTIADIIREPLVACGKSKGTDATIAELMDRVSLSPKLTNHLPHEVSGGQLQRACIARAIATNPTFVLFDEAISSLDVSVQAKILELLRELKGDMTYFFIAHDLQAVTYLCDDIYFLQKGSVVEQCSSTALAHVSSDYAKRLIGSAILFQSRWTGK